MFHWRMARSKIRTVYTVACIVQCGACALSSICSTHKSCACTFVLCNASRMWYFKYEQNEGYKAERKKFSVRGFLSFWKWSGGRVFFCCTFMSPIDWRPDARQSTLYIMLSTDKLVSCFARCKTCSSVEFSDRQTIYRLLERKHQHTPLHLLHVHLALLLTRCILREE